MARKMRRKWRSILATILLLALAAFEYVHCAVPTLDIASPGFSFDPENGKLADIPAEIRRLDGRVMAVEGYMIPIDQAEDIRRFALIPQLSGSGWPPPPSINQVVVANSPHGLKYNPERIRVFGRLHVRVTTDEGFIVGIYDMDVQGLTTVPEGPTAKWPWSIIAGLPTIFLVVIWRTWLIRRRLRRGGYCVRCGYDLRATPLRCPECGLATT
jgi:hypothetical protein